MGNKKETKWKDYECEGQTDIFDFIKPTIAGDVPKKCSTCYWNYRKTISGEHNGCTFKHNFGDKGCVWMPNKKSLYGCCATCEYANNFHYEGEDINNPVEEPNIYCTHTDGSLNRRCAYPEQWQKNFGCGSWHRQHEYDTCDRYKEENKKWQQ